MPPGLTTPRRSGTTHRQGLYAHGKHLRDKFSRAPLVQVTPIGKRSGLARTPIVQRTPQRAQSPFLAPLSARRASAADVDHVATAIEEMAIAGTPSGRLPAPLATAPASKLVTEVAKAGGLVRFGNLSAPSNRRKSTTIQVNPDGSDHRRMVTDP